MRAVCVVFLLTAITSSALAADLGQGRLYLGSTVTKPAELNTELEAQSLKNIELMNKAGVEITFPTFGFLQTGLRYMRHFQNADEDPADAATEFKADLTQDSMQGIVRVPLMKSDVIHLDAFGGLGVTNTAATLKTASLDGKLEKSASLITSAGVSLALGYKQFYFVMEASYEANKVEGFTKTGSLNDNVESLDLSGTSFIIGLMFDGIPIFKK